MKRSIVAVVLLLLAAAPAAAQRHGRYRGGDPADHALRLRVGGFVPDGDSSYWDEKALDFSGEAEDLEDFSFGLDYRLDVTPHFSLLFAGTAFAGETDQHYIDFTDEFGDDIVHTTTLDITSLTLGAIFHFVGPDAVDPPLRRRRRRPLQLQLRGVGRLHRLQPAAGGDLHRHLHRRGGDLRLLPARRPRSAGEPQRRPLRRGPLAARRGRAGHDFEGFGDLDLSGRDISAGVTWRF